MAPRIPPAIAPADAPKLAAPPPGAKGTVDPAEAARVAQRCSNLDAMDYFQILEVAYDATPADVKKAFYKDSRRYHPDRFFHLPDQPFKQQVARLYRHVTEAYYVLRDDQKRRKYLADVQGPERARKIRFTEASESEQKVAARKEQEEQIGVHPKGRQFYQTACADLDAGRVSAAERNLKMALTFEPQNARYKEKLAEVHKRLADASKGTDPFKIR